MAVGFDTWTVLPHKPIEKLASNLWRVSGTMGKVQRQMMLARMSDGRVVVHNAIALDDAEMAELEAWGEPSILVVPNGYHRQDARIWKQRYPSITVVAPAAAKKRVEKAVAVDMNVEDMPFAQDVRVGGLPGMPAECAMRVESESGVTLTFCDGVMNQPTLRGAMGFFLGPTGQPSVPRAMRWLFVKDKPAYRLALASLATTPNLERVCFGHGEPLTGSDAAAALRTASETVR